MKRFLTMLALSTLGLLASKAGGLMTNTNYHIAFDRMFARGTTFEIDGAYSNPAGLVWGHEGWQLSLNFQKPWQHRDIEAAVPALGVHHLYHGKASAPIVPALFAAYKKDRWALSAMIGIVGSGGFVEYDEGVPMFTVPLAARLASVGMAPGSYTIDASMKGKQYIYGGQVNFAYRITDHLSAAVGFRANYYDGYYRGHVVVAPAVNLQLDCDQKGWGFNPLVSIDYHVNSLTLSARYEFRAKLNIPNTVHENSDPQGALAAFADGVKTRYDMPSLLVVAAGYEFTPRLRAAVEYHFFDDKHAKMANDRQDELSHGTHEILAGAEYDISGKWTVSLGGQRTDYGLSDNYQTHTSFACDSYSLGCGAAVHLTEQLRLNMSYFCTLYSDYTKEQTAYQGLPIGGTDTFSRTNHVIGVGIDYRF